MTRVTQLIHDAGKYLLISVYPLPTHPTHNFTHNNGGNLETLPGWPKKLQHKQRVLMHRHQGLNVRHGLCHIYMRYLYIWVAYSFCLFCCLFIIVKWWYICGVLCGKWQARESTGMFGNLMAIYYIMPQFIQNHSRFVMLMKTCMIS